MSATEHTVYGSTETCWKCGLRLLELRPPMHGWRFYCRNCEHLTSPRAELETQLAARPGGALGAIGVVAAIQAKLNIQETAP